MPPSSMVALRSPSRKKNYSAKAWKQTSINYNLYDKCASMPLTNVKIFIKTLIFNKQKRTSVFYSQVTKTLVL